MEDQRRGAVETVPITYNEAGQSFELIVEGKRAFIDFKRKGNTLYLVHTEVPQDMAGKGVAASIVEKAFKYIEENGMKLAPACSYVQNYLKRHPAWNRLL